MTEEVLAAAGEALRRGETVALVTIVRTRGSTPQRVGAKMLVHADGRTIGTIGGGCYENDALGKAREAIASRTPLMARYELSDDLAQETGLICGGQMEVFVEPLQPAPRLVILGAGHVAWHLARVATEVGFRIQVVDDRQKFANVDRFPGADVVVAPIPAWLDQADIPASAYAVIVTRGHRHDLDALRALVTRDLRYLGLIGSRAKVARLVEALRVEGLPPEHLARLHAPIGLDIGAVTPAEIAVAIVAELVAVRYGKADAAGPGEPGVARSLRYTPSRRQHESSTPGTGG